MPRLAIVISSSGSVESLEGTLVSVLENRPVDSEVLVALQGPYSDPYDLKGEVRFIGAGADRPLVETINEAIGLTRAPFVHLLSSGCKVTEGWADRALPRFGDRQIGAVIPLVVDAGDPERILTAGIGYHAGGRRFLIGNGDRELSERASHSIVGPHHLAGFYRKSALEAVGGLCRHLALEQTDVDLGLALSRSGLLMAVEAGCKIMGSVDSRHAHGFQHALCEERLFWRNLPGAGVWSAVAAHAGMIAWELVRSLPRPRMVTQLAARIWAVCHMPVYLRGEVRRVEGAGPSAKPGQWRIDRPHSASARAESHATAGRPN